MKSRYLLVMALFALGVSFPVSARDTGAWKDVSDIGAYSLLGAALLTPAIRYDWQGLREAVYSVGLAQGVTFGLKAAVDRRRPDNSDNDSFPSGHTSLAFASATTLHRRYGWEYGIPAYTLATVTGIARQRARKHFWSDVFAGAGIGIASGWLFTNPYNNKVQLVPWADSKGGGILLGLTW